MVVRRSPIRARVQDRALLRTVVAGDERLLVAAIASLLKTLHGITVVTDAPDLVVLTTTGERARSSIGETKEQFPGARIVCLARSWSPEEVAATLESGALSCLLTDLSPDDLATALRQAGRGEITLPAGLMSALIARASAPEPRAVGAPLSPRELEVLALVAQGRTNKEIAQQLLLSVRTIENHLAGIYAKLGVRSRTEAALIAVREGFVRLR